MSSMTPLEYESGFVVNAEHNESEAETLFMLSTINNISETTVACSLIWTIANTGLRKELVGGMILVRILGLNAIGKCPC